jgi:translation initiation factor 2 subunit 3
MLSGRWTDTHSEEIKKGITIRLGYADFLIRECPKCKAPEKYALKEVCVSCGKNTVPSRRLSIVDAPGHESLMATMLSGSAIMDGALLLVAANESCPQPQTREHLVALQIAGVKNVVVVQSKIDLVSKERALESYAEIKAFLKGTEYERATIIPVSAQQNINIDVLLDAVMTAIPAPERDKTLPPLMLVARSFDVNRPGTSIDELHGGVLGGTVKQGVLKKGDAIEIKPGRRVESKGQVQWEPVSTSIASVRVGATMVDEIGPGGSVGVMTFLDPGIVKSDALVGSIVGIPGKLPPVWEELKLEITLLERVVGTKDDLVVEPLKIKEPLMLNVNSAATVGIVLTLKKSVMTCRLKIPVCALVGSRVTISRLLGTRWRLIGYGIIL